MVYEVPQGTARSTGQQTRFMPRGIFRGMFQIDCDSHAASWQAKLLKLNGTRLLGRFLASSRDRLREVAKQLGVRHLANVG